MAILFLWISLMLTVRILTNVNVSQEFLTRGRGRSPFPSPSFLQGLLWQDLYFDPKGQIFAKAAQGHQCITPQRVKPLGSPELGE
ncbi:MAG: hypothetical protein EA366_00720 [Spirulina sp. DLM2.Bin59]|nr:MAG: hypothetical protein EA366_00720 [Spirulina sp. DLM2.Bin59]